MVRSSVAKLIRHWLVKMMPLYLVDNNSVAQRPPSCRVADTMAHDGFLEIPDAGDLIHEAKSFRRFHLEQNLPCGRFLQPDHRG